MDIRKVKKLIELLEESNIDELEIKEGEESVRISRNSGAAAVAAPQYYAQPAAAPAPAPVVEEVPAPVVEEVVEAAPVVEKPKKAAPKAKKPSSKAEAAPRKRTKKASSSQSKK